MKIHSVLLGNTFNSLLPFEQDFSHAQRIDGKIDPICLVGVNGSGKSNLLELIVEPFFYLERLYRFDVRTKKILTKIEIIYSLSNNRSTLIKVETFSGPIPKVYIKATDDSEWSEVTNQEIILESLPKKIIGYTSGMNETLSFRLNQLDDEYSKLVLENARESSREKLHDNRMVFLDYASNEAITIANFLFRPADELAVFNDLLRIKDLESFKIIINLKRKGKSGKNSLVILSKELKENIEKLKNCSLCYNIDEELGYFEFDYLNDEQTKLAFLDNFITVYNLFMCFQKLELLNPINLEKKYRRTRSKDFLLEGRPALAKEDKVFRFDEIFIKISSPEKIIPYIGISDGEHQFLQILGAVMIFESDDILFLLDEPETHFNPLWRTKFIHILNEITKGRDQEFVITTHSPFVVSDCKGYRVFKFCREGDRVTFKPIGVETFGTSFDLILQKAFDIDKTISDEANEEMKKLIREGSEDEINTFLEETGPSIEKIGLIKHLKSLKS